MLKYSAFEEEKAILEAKISDLQAQLSRAKADLEHLLARNPAQDNESSAVQNTLPMTLSEYRRYGRQMILEGIGLPGQLKLKNASVLVVGAGGLGCPAIQYLAAAGVGTLGIVDHDIVELSNLQRQILHSDATIGVAKAQSAKAAAERLQPLIKVVPHVCSLDPINARDILSKYDIILDCTDNLPTRYLLSDTAVLVGKPLVSGAALKFDGQLCVYNLGSAGPCYRCIFPKPPKRDGEGSCEEVGVLGVVTGVIGTLQAMEAIKIITGLHDEQPSLLIFSALSSPSFRTMKLRGRRPNCPSCGGDPSMRDRFVGEQDYVAFCGGETPDLEETGKIDISGRIKPQALADSLKETNATIIDVRSPTEFSICHLPGSINVPLSLLEREPANHISQASDTFVVCRLGNDSQIAASVLRSVSGDSAKVYDLVGGLRAWSKEVNPLFPIY
ncbi:Urmylation protein [Tulasnella sp. 424]|nr:Urmylation protein [Tulasnella sp. 424]KAG8973878.1 Urmylation protein [Tulasnella sp. 425]